MRPKDAMEASPACLVAVPHEDATGALPYSEQMARNVRTRLVAASAVILVHAAYPPGHAELALLTPHAAATEALVFRVLVSFPVDAFILLAFLGLAPRIQAGARAWQLVRTTSRRLVPPQVFWAGAFLCAKAALQHQVPSARAAVEGVVLGQAASHLYFIPQLLALTLAAPLLDRFARSALAATAACGALALASVAMEVALGTANPWVHAAVGYLGLAPFAVTGLALARSWRGTAPGARRSLSIVLVGIPVAIASIALLARISLAAPLAPTILSRSEWLGNWGCALAVPILLLAIPCPRLSRWQLRLVPYTLGVYLVHPFFLQALRAAEAHVAALHGHPMALVLPNAALAAALSLGLVAVLARTPLRRFVL